MKNRGESEKVEDDLVKLFRTFRVGHVADARRARKRRRYSLACDQLQVGRFQKRRSGGFMTDQEVQDYTATSYVKRLSPYKLGST
jgi:hypothetical protein